MLSKAGTGFKKNIIRIFVLQYTKRSYMCNKQQQLPDEIVLHSSFS